MNRNMLPHEKPVKFKFPIRLLEVLQVLPSSPNAVCLSEEQNAASAFSSSALIDLHTEKS